MGFWKYLKNSRDAKIRDLKGLVDSYELSDVKSCLGLEINKLRVENGKLKLIIAAILRKSFEKGLFTEEEIQALCRDIDAEDGKTDGQFHGEVLPNIVQEQLDSREIKIDFSGNVRERKS